LFKICYYFPTTLGVCPRIYNSSVDEPTSKFDELDEDVEAIMGEVAALEGDVLRR
jgi:hypothetical protein